MEKRVGGGSAQLYEPVVNVQQVLSEPTSKAAAVSAAATKLLGSAAQ